MRVLLYTINDCKQSSLGCVDLLLSSIVPDIQYDFIILTNNISAISNKYNILIDKNITSTYIGYLKYSPQLPINYDYYIYLDSDILYFDSISKLIDSSLNFTIVTENQRVSDCSWFYFSQNNLNAQNIQKLQNAIALNAGSFAFKGCFYNLIQNAYVLYSQYYKNDSDHDVKLEQAIYNYIIHTQTNYKLDTCFDITESVQLFASRYPSTQSKKLYHFCGYTNEMNSKYLLMKEFYDLYKK